MSWLDTLQPASVNDIPFYVDGNDADFGRRAVVHEYPYRNTPWVDDMGQLTRRLSLRAFILDNDGDIARQRQALMTALESDGLVKLVHPRLGQMTVQSGTHRWSTSRSGGREDFTFEFLPPGARREPDTRDDTASLLQAQCDRVLASNLEQFNRDFSLDGVADFVRLEAVSVMDNALGGLRKINGQIDAVTAPLQNLAQSISDIGSELSELILQPQTLLGRLASVVGEVFDAFDNITNAFAAYQDLGVVFGDVAPVPGNTPDRLTQANNQAALGNAMTTMATVEFARMVAVRSRAVDALPSQSPFDSYNQAIAVRDALVTAIDALLGDADGAHYHALLNFSSQVTRHIENHGLRLPRIEYLQLIDTQPALVVAHRLYGDATRADELVLRNGVRHPLFMPTNRTLEVLRNG